MFSGKMPKPVPKLGVYMKEAMICPGLLGICRPEDSSVSCVSRTRDMTYTKHRFL
jgi:hypothetical protein